MSGGIAVKDERWGGVSPGLHGVPKRSEGRRKLGETPAGGEGNP